MTDQNFKDFSPMPYSLKQDIGKRAAFGLIVLQTDATIEYEFNRIFNQPGLALYVNRIPVNNNITPDTLEKMADQLPKSASLFPNAIQLSSIGYGCTSGATIIGEQRIESLIHEIHPKTNISNPITATKAALRSLQAQKIGFLTPYIEEVSKPMRQNLAQGGIQVTSFASFCEQNDDRVAHIDPDDILKAVLKLGAEDNDAVFVSCTNLHVLDVIPVAEQRLGKPVISSNQALAWHMLRISEIGDHWSEFGFLFDQTL